ncbi:MAG: T9SS type A sorting domain-containing protein [Calditrichaeota bacterium]|nr:T9SS type A sorting domain-containing protein [Calditrichota bacterium]
MQDWINERYGEEDNFDFYAANVAENENHVAEYVEQIGLETPVLFVSSQIYQQYLLRGRSSPYPLDYVIDGDGIVRYAQHEYEPELMLETIDRLLEDDDDDRIGDDNSEFSQPGEFILHPAFPNPFNSSTRLTFELVNPQIISLGIFDVNGTEIVDFGEGSYPGGIHSLNWDASGLPAGTYIFQFKSGERSATNRLILIR